MRDRRRGGFDPSTRGRQRLLAVFVGDRRSDHSFTVIMYFLDLNFGELRKGEVRE